MKHYIIILFLFFTLIGNTQCNGTQSFTLSPLPVAGTYQPGQVVTICYTMNSYTQTGSNWIEGFVITLGAGFSSPTPFTNPSNCGGGVGSWIWLTSSTSTTLPITTVGPGYFYDLDGDGLAGDDFGDSGTCIWTLCIKATVLPGYTPSNLSINVTAGSDGVWGSFTSSLCDVTPPYNIFTGNTNPTTPVLSLISHN